MSMVGRRQVKGKIVCKGYQQMILAGNELRVPSTQSSLEVKSLHRSGQTSQGSTCTVLPAKSDSDVVFCLQLLKTINLYTPLELMRIDRSLVYYPNDRSMRIGLIHK